MSVGSSTDLDIPSGVDSTDHAFDYIDLFAGIGGFHAALSALGGRCVYVSEIDEQARAVYERNWGADVYQPDPNSTVIRGDINIDAPQRDTVSGRQDGQVRVPKHHVLAAGFPCQAFSKSGQQLGILDKTRGTLFHNIIRILQERTPKLVFLENVRNLAGPKHTETWDTIIAALEEIGYEVAHTPMVVSPHFIDPAHGGAPQIRERVFILGIYKGTAHRKRARDVRPTLDRGPMEGWDPQSWDLAETPLPWLGGVPILQRDDEIANLASYQLTASEVRWVNAWDNFVLRLRKAGVELPGHPLWTDYFVTESALDEDDLASMPDWKRSFVLKNSRFYQQHRKVIEEWRADNTMTDFASFPDSRRKFEWQAQDSKTLWECILQLRPSGIRAKRPTYVPALVAITQTSIIGSKRRRLTPVEAARLQGLPDTFTFGDQPESATYKQLGNGVNAGAVHYAMCKFVERYRTDLEPVLPGLVAAVLGDEASAWPTISPSAPAPATIDAVDLEMALARA
ncbi:DNA (cytosine-5-)-methyltransferase [Cellulomonas sp.]